MSHIFFIPAALGSSLYSPMPPCLWSLCYWGCMRPTTCPWGRLWNQACRGYWLEYCLVWRRALSTTTGKRKLNGNGKKNTWRHFNVHMQELEEAITRMHFIALLRKELIAVWMNDAWDIWVIAGLIFQTGDSLRHLSLCGLVKLSLSSLRNICSLVLGQNN